MVVRSCFYRYSFPYLLLSLILFAAPAFADTDCTDTISTGVPQVECQALIDLYTQNNGSNWRRKTDWNSNVTICNWYGVTCSGGHVTELELGYENMTGTLPSSLSNLLHLEKLKLSANNLTGGFPDVSALSNLTEIQIGDFDPDYGFGNNNFSGAFPQSLFTLSNLELLYAGGAGFDSGFLPNSINVMTSLQNADLSGNSLTGSIPSTIDQLTNLDSLNLSSNQLSGSLTSNLGNLTTLVNLNLGSNSFSGNIPSSLGNLANLRTLNLDHNNFSGSLPSELGSLTQLQTLTIGSNSISGSLPASFSGLTNIRAFHAATNNFSGTIADDFFAAWSSIQSIELGSNSFSGPLPSSLFNHTTLGALRLSGAGFSGPLPSNIGNATGLVDLRLDNNHFSGNIPSGITALNNLDWFDLSYNELECEVPPGIENIAGLNNGTGYFPPYIDNISLYGNKLFASGSTLTWLNTKNPGWLSTQDNDSDGDGTYDCLETCPNDPDKVSPGICGCGIADTDSDGDGTPDCTDECDADPAKIAPGVCGCGVSERDTNSDGVCDPDPSIPHYSVSGTLRLRNGQPLEGATIRSRVGEAVTDRFGHYTISNIPQGSYTFYVREWDDGYSISRDFKMNLIPSRNCPESELPLNDHLKTPECKFDPLFVDQDLTQMDFKVNRCINPAPGVVYVEDETGHCIRENTRPGTPMNLSASDGTSTEGVELSWTLTAGATNYQIFRAGAGELSDPTGGTLVDTVSGISYVDTSAIPGVHYDYVVRAVNRFGTGDLSNIDEGWRATSGSNNSGQGGTSGNDSDGDGVTDDQENEDGTDPSDPGSFETVLQSPAFTKYNTFLSQFNWLELIGAGTETVEAKITLFDLNGAQIGNPIYTSVAPQAQVDIDIHSRVPQDTYGIVRIDFNYTDPGVELVGRMTVYRRDPHQEKLPIEKQTFSFAFTRELRNPTRGVTYGTANSYDPQGRGYLVPNWVEVVNLASSAKEFTIRVYDQEGRQLSQKAILVAPQGEFDVQAGHEFGEGVYLVQILPRDGSADYFATVTRYSSNAKGGNEAETYNFAMPIEARAGTSEKQFVPMSNLHGTCWLQTNWVELVNVRATDSVVDVRFRSQSGELIADLPSITLHAHAQEHLNASGILDLVGRDLHGSVEISPRERGSVIVQSNFYFHDCKANTLQTAYSSRGQISGPSLQLGSFNRFLGMKNLLHVINTSSDTLGLDLKLVSGSSVLAEQTQSISPYNFVDWNLSDGSSFNTRPDTYGTLSIGASDKRKLVVENVRFREVNGRVDFAIATGVR